MTAPALGTAHRIEIAAPDGPAALVLEHRLELLRPTAIWRRGHWLVELAGVHDVDAIETEVRGWLRQIGEVAATVSVDGDATTVMVEPRGRHRATNADFVG